MDFEYDPQKSESNKIKHGIEFEEAQELWRDGRAKQSLLSAGTETRFLLVGMIAEKHWSAIYTYRNEKSRIISGRRSRAGEVQDYGEDNG